MADNDVIDNNYSDYKSEIAFMRAVIFLTVSFLVTVGNVFVLISLKNVKKLKHTTKMFICSLSIADLLVGCILIPLRLNEVFYAPWTRTVRWCELAVSVNVLNISASTFNLMAIIIDRYIYLKSPLHYDRIVTQRRSMIVIVTLWVTVFVFSFVPIFSGAALLSTAYRGEADHLCKYANVLKREYMAFMCVIDILPLVVFAVVYVNIYCIAQAQMKQIKTQARSALSYTHMRMLKRRERRTTRMIITLFLVFYCCWIPAIIADCLSISQSEFVTQPLILFVSVLLYFNSFFNCVIYYAWNDEFRKSFRKLLHVKERPPRFSLRNRRRGSLRQRTLSRIRLGGSSPYILKSEDEDCVGVAYHDEDTTNDINNNNRMGSLNICVDNNDAENTTSHM